MTRLVRRRHRRPEWDPEPLADALEMVASGLRAGLPPGEALMIAGECTSWGRAEAARLRRVADAIGLPTRTRGWQDPADTATANQAYRTLDAVWTLALDTGAPLADAIDSVSTHIREDGAVRDRLAAQASAPRTSQRLLTVLPLLGPVLALFIGADLIELYLASVAGTVSVVVGLCLTVVGGWWSRAMVVAALAPRRYTDIARGQRGGSP